MKVALITDVHFGVRRNSEIFLASQLKFFREVFIPYLKTTGITTIFVLGDFFDNRVNIDSKILNAVIDLFDKDLREFSVHMIVGNHDSYLESSVEINSVRPLALYENVKMYDKLESIEFAGRKILMSPWVTNNEEFIKHLEGLEHHDMCFGHFNFCNFKMFKNQDSEHGLESELFYSKFKLTVSGHFHTRSQKTVGDSTILYMGNPFHFTRNDIGDERGFLVMDMEDMSYYHVNNDVSIKFVSLKYPEEFDRDIVYGNHVDLYVDYDEKYDEYKVQEYIEKITALEPAFPVALKTFNKLSVDNPDDINIGGAEELFREYFEKTEMVDKEEVRSLIMELFLECKSEI